MTPEPAIIDLDDKEFSSGFELDLSDQITARLGVPPKTLWQRLHVAQKPGTREAARLEDARRGKAGFHG